MQIVIRVKSEASLILLSFPSSFYFAFSLSWPVLRKLKATSYPERNTIGDILRSGFTNFILLWFLGLNYYGIKKCNWTHSSIWR